MKDKYKIIVLDFLFVLMITIYFVPLKTTINKTYTGVQFTTNDPSYCEKATITVDGTITKYAIQDDYFEGSITIDLPGNLRNDEGKFTYQDNTVYIHNFDDVNLKLGYVGKLIFLENNSKILYEGSCDLHINGFDPFIYAPSTSRSEALNEIEILSRKYNISELEWLALTKQLEDEKRNEVNE